MSEEKQKKEVDILDQVRNAEKVLKTHLLLKQLQVIKKLAKEVLITKEKTKMILEDIGLKEEDVKKVIDFVNSLPEVQLSETEIKELKEDVKDEGKKERQTIQKKIEESPLTFTGASGSLTSANCYYAGTTGNGMNAYDTVTLQQGTTSQSLNIQI
jgi:uncharacterized protein YoxC